MGAFLQLWGFCAFGRLSSLKLWKSCLLAPSGIPLSSSRRLHLLHSLRVSTMKPACECTAIIFDVQSLLVVFSIFCCMFACCFCWFDLLLFNRLLAAFLVRSPYGETFQIRFG